MGFGQETDPSKRVQEETERRFPKWELQSLFVFSALVYSLAEGYRAKSKKLRNSSSAGPSGYGRLPTGCTQRAVSMP